MKKKILFLMLCMVLLAVSPAFAAEITQKPIYLENYRVEFQNPALEEKGCVIVPVRELAELTGFQIKWDAERQKVVAYNDKVSAIMFIGNSHIRVLNLAGGEKIVEAVLPPTIINSVTYVPLRAISEAFGGDVQWSAGTNTIYIYMKDGQTDSVMEMMPVMYEETVGAPVQYQKPVAPTVAPLQPIPSATSSAAVTMQIGTNNFYSQYDPAYIAQYSGEPYKWTAGRNGYCYVTSYAMLLSNITGTAVTPKDVADINIAKCGNGTMCYHGDIVSRYGCKLVQALPSGSPYFKGYDAGRGMTSIDNSTPETVIAAIKEALSIHPEGVMVRDNTMPHTMVAVGYSGNEIYFNDPALSKGNTTWSETCLKRKSITTITGIMAIDRR